MKLAPKIGKIIRKFRLIQDLTLDELSAKTNLSASYLSAIENGTRSPNITIVETIANALNIPVETIFLLSLESKDDSLKKQIQDLIFKAIEEDLNEVENKTENKVESQVENETF